MRLETRQPLEQSLLWGRQARFYEAQGPRAWTRGTVPWRITSTPLIAAAFADVLAAFAAELGDQRPLCVLDVGAGTGRLAYLLCRELAARGVRFSYLMTDVAASNLEAWRAHPQLAPLFRAGVLDAARFDARRAAPLRLVASGKTWAPGALPGPLVAIGTYLLDTLPHSLWRRPAEAGSRLPAPGSRGHAAEPTGAVLGPLGTEGQPPLAPRSEAGEEAHGVRELALRRAQRKRSRPRPFSPSDVQGHGFTTRDDGERVGARRLLHQPRSQAEAGWIEAGDVTLEAPAADSPLAELAWRFDFAPAAPPPFVAGYARALPAGLRFLVPDGAFACVRALEALGGGRALCLFADKGPRTVQQLAALPFPPLARHGCVSAAVNFHALRAWAGWRFWCEPAAGDAAFGVYAVGRGWGRLPATRRAFEAGFGADQPLAAQAALDAAAARAGSATLDELLAALEASAGSPDALIRLAAPLRRRAPAATPAQAGRLAGALERVGENHFELAEDADVAFEAASVLHLARQLGPAMRLYLRSIAARGEHPTTRFNLALCCLDLGGLDEARAQLEAVLTLAPDHARARELLSSLPGPSH